MSERRAVGHEHGREGDVFALPTPGGFGRVRLARRPRRRRVFLGYFFGPLVPDASDLTDRDLDPRSALLVARAGDMGIREGEWTFLGPGDSWDREAWPIPRFHAWDPLVDGRLWIAEYDESLVTSVSRRVARPEEMAEASALPRDGLHGHVSAENNLAYLAAGTIGP